MSDSSSTSTTPLTASPPAGGRAPVSPAAAGDTHNAGDLPVVVIGAGPVGLAAAANLLAYDLPVLVLEAGERVGQAVLGWGHIRTFTPWQYIVDERAEKLLAPTGWVRPDTPVPPTGDELAEHYLQPLAAALGDRVRTGARVVAVSRDGMDKTRTVGRARQPFLVRVQQADGTVSDLRAQAVLDASGTWEQPNPLGSSGLPVPDEAKAAAAGLLVGALPDVLGAHRASFAGRRTLVVGSGHSATNTLLALGQLATQEPGTQIVWAVRGAGPERAYGGGEGDELAERGQLGSDLRSLVDSGAVELVTGFRTTAVHAEPAEDGGQTVTVVGDGADGPVELTGLHAVVAATGFRPDLAVLAELQLDLDPGLEAPRALAPLVDPQFHSCGTVPPHGHRELAHPEPGFYTVGMKSYGRAPTFLIPTGNEQVRSIAAALAGDLAAADDVQLVLPETGVCSTGADGLDTATTGGCCGSPVGELTEDRQDLEFAVPAAAHRDRPTDVPAQGFPTGRPGGGLVAELATGGTGGCCSG